MLRVYGRVRTDMSMMPSLIHCFTRALSSWEMISCVPRVHFTLSIICPKFISASYVLMIMLTTRNAGVSFGFVPAGPIVPSIAGFVAGLPMAPLIAGLVVGFDVLFVAAPF